MRYTKSEASDCKYLPDLLDDIEGEINSVCADMAYDTVNCRDAVRRKANQLIPPNRRARESKNNRNYNKRQKNALEERDKAIRFIKSKERDEDMDISKARTLWKKEVGYHQRSLVETTMYQIKSHCSDYLTNRTESNRVTQAKIKCKVINMIMSAK